MIFSRALASSALAALTLTLGTVDASAQTPGYYIGAGLGAALQQDSDLSGTGISGSVDTDMGWVGQLSIGRRYGNGFRSEIEAAYSDAYVDSISGATGAGGDISSLSAIINGLYDFKLEGPLTPYLGLGIGVARINYDGVTPVGGSRIDDSDTVFAYQGIAGVSYDLGDDMALTADYRYFRTLDPGFRTDGGTSVDSEFGEHRIMVGLRWNFGAPKPKPKPMVKAAAQPAPKPAPPPAPKPAPVVEPPKPQVPRTYLVFFDWDRANLRADALAIVREAAANAGKTQVTRIISTGHADRSGPDRYNLGLSQRRAQAVANELVRLGIAAKEIDIVWKGEREPLVPTGDGVREPQNRRVEIVFN